jgi:predicted nucleic acid-binding protein
VSEALVVDSSVAVKWYIPEPGSDRAETLLSDGSQLLAPDLLIPEVGNVLWKRRRDISVEDREAIAGALSSACSAYLYPSSVLLRGALSIADAYGRSVYDSLYLALAVSQDCLFVTADERFANSLDGTDLRPFIRVL